MSDTKHRNRKPDQSRSRRNTRLEQAETFVDLAKLHQRSIRGSARRLLQRPASSLVTLFVVAVALLPALLFGLNSNLASLLSDVQGNARVTLYLKDGVVEAKGQEVSDSLLTRKGIKIKGYISPSQALDEFRVSSGLEDLLREIAANPLLGAIALTPVDV